MTRHRRAHVERADQFEARVCQRIFQSLNPRTARDRAVRAFRPSDDRIRADLLGGKLSGFQRVGFFEDSFGGVFVG